MNHRGVLSRWDAKLPDSMDNGEYRTWIDHTLSSGLLTPQGQSNQICFKEFFFHSNKSLTRLGICHDPESNDSNQPDLYTKLSSRDVHVFVPFHGCGRGTVEHLPLSRSLGQEWFLTVHTPFTVLQKLGHQARPMRAGHMACKRYCVPSIKFRYQRFPRRQSSVERNAMWASAVDKFLLG